MTQGAIEVWTKLPDGIRFDPLLVQFLRQYQRINSELNHLNYFEVSFQFHLPLLKINHTSIRNEQSPRKSPKHNFGQCVRYNQFS